MRRRGCLEGRRRGTRGLGLRDGFGRGDERRRGGNEAGKLCFQRRARADLEGGGNETSQYIQRGRERSRGGLGAEHGRQRVGWLIAAAGGYHVVDGVVQVVGGNLNAFEILAQCARDGLLDSVGFLWHFGSGAI